MHLKEIQKTVVNVYDIYTNRCKINRDDDWCILKLREEVGEITQGKRQRDRSR